MKTIKFQRNTALYTDCSIELRIDEILNIYYKARGKDSRVQMGAGNSMLDRIVHKPCYIEWSLTIAIKHSLREKICQNGKVW